MKKIILTTFILLFTVSPVLAEGAYERVIKTNVLRCGFALWDPAVIKDLQTGQMKGTFVEFMEAVGKVTGLKIEWTQ